MKFKPVFVEARDLDDCWHRLLWELHQNGRRYKITSGSYEGAERVAFDFVSGFIHYPHTRPLSVRLPEGSSLPPPTSEDDIEQYFAEYLMDSQLKENEDYRYSTWIVGGEYETPNGIEGIIGNKSKSITINSVIVPNQIEWIINHFKRKGLGNEHCYLTVGYPESNFAYDIPYKNEQERKTSPCLRGLDFRIINTCLTLQVNYRSWDLWGGWPVNMGGFALLNEYVAGEIGVEPGPLSFSCKSLHCYDFQLDVVKQRLGK